MSENKHIILLVTFLVTLFVLEFQSFRVLNVELNLDIMRSIWTLQSVVF